MKHTRLTQLGIAFCIAASLLVSAVSACACLHHQQNKAAEQHSCHQTSTENADVKSSSAKTAATTGVDCSCLEAVPRLSAKSENPKLKKHAAANSPAPLVRVTFVLHTVKAVKTFARPLYLSDSFYNISPSRGPPRA